jgi:hypothetical protein
MGLMEHRWRRIWYILRRHKWIALVVLATVCLVTVSFALTVRKPESDPVKGTRSELVHLQKDAAKLHGSFNSQASSAAKAKSYFAYVSNMAASCDKIAAYNKSWQKNHADNTDTALMNQSDALCQDISKLTTFSQATFVPLKPLLLADSTPRRYQTLWPFAGRTRSAHEKAASEALHTLRQNTTSSADSIDFPSEAVSELSQLKTAIENNKGLDYMPALHTFQERMRGERERLWLQYAGLSSLEQILENLTRVD